MMMMRRRRLIGFVLSLCCLLLCRSIPSIAQRGPVRPSGDNPHAFMGGRSWAQEHYHSNNGIQPRREPPTPASVPTARP
ncbi:hypothetical protein O6P43_005227 [Quillaja saponaria]|uniref:Secreted protein n=1 Tax=Quillaja saponaria TaxID=32244 RepID=A0AAD7Q5K2_QUISA|nr:hypothetical protein O6P43_005227 [Quillaja saponaria]